MVWSAKLAYAIGLITTDGSLSIDGRHINLTSKDIDQIRTFAKILGLKNKIGLKYSSYKKDKEYYQIQFGNVKFYRFLMKIGLTPHKTKTIGSVAIPKPYFADFLRGHLDGDGCTYSYWDKRWKSSFMFYTTFVSASLVHLEWVKSRIKDLYNIEGKIKFSGKSTYQLVYAKNASIKLIGIMYNKNGIPYLKRKHSKIMRALGIINKQAGMEKLVNSQP